MTGAPGHDLQALLEVARGALAAEEAGLRSLRAVIETQAFSDAIEFLLSCRGRLLVSGVGKSGLIAQRIAASLRSTGTKAVFLHPTDAVHGDLGLVEPGDVGIFLSKSGESAELLPLLPIFERLPVPYLAVTCAPSSRLARGARVSLALGPLEEAGPITVVPTTSATVFSALGDLLLTTLYVARGFRPEDLAFLHPGGVIGSQVTTTVGEVMRKGRDLPLVRDDATLRDALVEMIAKKLGLTSVVDSNGCLVGILTDGDIRRIVHKHGRIDDLSVAEVMTRNPRTIEAGALVARAVSAMELNPAGAITALLVVDAAGRAEGVIHLHDCLKLRGGA